MRTAIEVLREAMGDAPPPPGCGRALARPVRYHFMCFSHEYTEEVVRKVYAGLPEKWSGSKFPVPANTRGIARQYDRDDFARLVGVSLYHTWRALDHLVRVGAIVRTGRVSYRKEVLPSDPLHYWRWSVVRVPCEDSTQQKERTL